MTQTLLTISGFVLVLFFQVANTAYLMGKMKAILNGTVKNLKDLKEDVKDKNRSFEKTNKDLEKADGELHARITDHVKDFHTKGRN